MSETTTAPQPNTQLATIDPVVQQQKGEAWRKMGVALYNKELQLQAWAQQIIAKIPAPKTVAELPQFEKTLAEAKAELIQLQEQRKELTGKLNTVIERQMLPEKSIAAHIATLTPILVQLKQQHQQSQKANEAKQTEIKQVREKTLLHIADLNASLLSANTKLIADAYEYALTNIEPAKLVPYLAKVEGRVTEKNMTIPAPKITAQQNTQAEVDAIIVEVFKPRTPAEYIAQFKADLALKFADYELAYKNKAKALEISKADQQTKANEINKDKEQMKGAASFVAASSSFGGSVGPAIKELKKVYTITIDETQENAVLVMSAFVANLNKCLPKLRISKWWNLQVKQMIAALEQVKTEDNNFQFEGLVFTEQDKL